MGSALLLPPTAASGSSCSDVDVQDTMGQPGAGRSPPGPPVDPPTQMTGQTFLPLAVYKPDLRAI